MASGGRKVANQYPIEQNSVAVSFDADAFNEFLNVQGIRLIHCKALRCPVGMTDIDDNRKPHEDHEGCSNGFLYYKAGIVTVGMQGNGNSTSSHDMGLMEHSHITATFPQFYDQTDTPVSIAMFDRFFLDEQELDAKILVPTWHLQVAHQSGLDKLMYPAVWVEKLVDMNGVEYKQDEDFCVHNGLIKWTGKRPGYQIDVKRGAIYSIRYHYRPYWYCSQLLHEIRVAQIDTFDGRALKRMPQQILLSREHTFTNENVDRDAKDSTSARQTQVPNDGGWGAPR